MVLLHGVMEKVDERFSEFEKMRGGQLYHFDDAEVLASVTRANELCARLSQLTLSSPEYRSIIETLIPDIPVSSAVNPPFHCDHGSGIHIGPNTFINYDCIMLDAATITIGAN